MSYAFTLCILVLASAEMEDKSFKQAKKYLNSYLEFLSLPEENKAIARQKIKIARVLRRYVLKPCAFCSKSCRRC